MLSMDQLEIPIVAQMYELADRLAEGDKVEGLIEPDTIPSEEYRRRIIAILHRLGLIESSGGPFFFDMIRYAPSPRCAEALAHIASEELSHGRLLLECLEPFGIDYAASFHDFIAGNAAARMSQVSLADPGTSHARSWTDVLAVTMLVDPAGILLVGARVMSGYGPLARASADTLIDERGHASFWEVWGQDVLQSSEGRAELQRSVDKVFPVAIGSLGRPESINPEFSIERELGLWSVDPAALQRALLAMLEVTLPAVGLKIPDSDPDYSNAFW